MITSSVNLSVSDYGHLTHDLEALERSLQVALRRAIAILSRWIRTHALRELGQELGVRRDRLQRRIRLSINRTKDGGAVVWLGLNPVGLHDYKAQPRQVARGVRAAGRLHESAFIETMGSGELLSWRREGRARLPIEQVRESIEDPAVDVLERFEGRVGRQFQAVMDRQIRYELSK